MEKLIQKVKENRLLYDDKSTYYRDTERRHQAWDKIGSQLNLTGEEARSSWDRLRRCFINARNRRRVREHESGMIIHPWKYDEEMAFIWPFVERNRKTAAYDSTNNDTESQDISYDSSSWIPSPCNETTLASELTEQVKPEIDETEEYIKVRSEFHNGNEVAHTSSNSNRAEETTFENKRKYYCDDYNEKASPIKRRHVVQEERSVFDMDENDLFFLSMSKMTKSLPSVVERAKVKLAVGNAVLQALIDSNISPSERK